MRLRRVERPWVGSAVSRSSPRRPAGSSPTGTSRPRSRTASLSLVRSCWATSERVAHPVSGRDRAHHRERRRPQQQRGALPERIRGVVELITEARDTPQPSAPPSFAGHPVTPALLRWRVVRDNSSRRPDGDPRPPTRDRANIAAGRVNRVSIRVGDRVPAMLSEWVDRSEHNRVVAGGVVIAALSGHPCEEEPGGRISFVWPDHVAIAAGLSLNVAFDHSHVKRPRGAAIKAIARGARIDYGERSV